jgi:hypothetical protein
MEGYPLHSLTRVSHTFVAVQCQSHNKCLFTEGNDQLGGNVTSLFCNVTHDGRFARDRFPSLYLIQLPASVICECCPDAAENVAFAERLIVGTTKQNPDGE